MGKTSLSGYCNIPLVSLLSFTSIDAASRAKSSLQDLFVGPFTIRKKHTHLRYYLNDMTGKQLKNSVHLNRLQPWFDALNVPVEVETVAAEHKDDKVIENLINTLYKKRNAVYIRDNLDPHLDTMSGNGALSTGHGVPDSSKPTMTTTPTPTPTGSPSAPDSKDILPDDSLSINDLVDASEDFYGDGIPENTAPIDSGPRAKPLHQRNRVDIDYSTTKAPKSIWNRLPAELPRTRAAARAAQLHDSSSRGRLAFSKKRGSN